jgi:hypothetical protein
LWIFTFYNIFDLERFFSPFWRLSFHSVVHVL